MYEFKERDAYDFANHIRAQTYVHGEELNFRECPYCHGKGKTNERTFSINLKTGQFKCLRASCGVSGNMVTLSRDFDFSLGTQIDEYYRPKKQYRQLKKPKEKIIPKPEALAYLEKRGISDEVAKKYEITVQTEHPNVLVFPFYDDKGVMQTIKYRKTDFDKERDHNKEWFEKNTKPILFGMYQCKDFGQLAITEGQLDSLAVATAGIENVVSVPNGAKGFTWLPYCWEWINKFQEVVVFGDYEKGHITLLDELSKRLKTTVKHVREEDYGDCKDANEILLKYGKERVKQCVENAVVIPIKHVIELADVEDVDLSKITKLRTGISKVDGLLYGGLPFGGMVLISGKSGEGKSSLSSQILINAIRQGFKCFAYSGELANHQFKGWMDFQIAGPRHVIEYQTNKWGDKGYTISKSNKQLISEWYREKCFLYDNTAVDDEQESLVKTVEETIMQYGVQVILLDNLMTAIDLETMRGEDKYDRQSKFVKQLSRLALKHNVLILMVAHKRKNNFTTNENDEISGSGDIGNLATVILAYERGKDIEPDQRLIKISKNRLFGKLETDGFVMNFDEKSKRIYGEGDDVNVDYGWNPENAKDGFLKIDENEPTPFG